MRRAVTFLATLLLAAGAGAQVNRFGSEFQVSTYTNSFQGDLSVAAFESGDFVVAWESFQDGSSTGVFARRVVSDVPTSDFQVNTYTASYQSDPAVALSGSGDFVVAWTSRGQDGQDDGVFARRFSSGGALSVEFQVNTYTPGHQRFPAVAVESDGDFVLAWASHQDGSYSGIFAQQFSSSGFSVASEFQVNTFTANYQSFPQIAALPLGNFVVVWSSAGGQDGSLTGVFARHFSSAGVALAVEFQVNTFTNQVQKYPAVAPSSNDGAFTVVWESGYGQDGDKFGIVARRFSSAGVALTGELQVNTYATGNQRYPTVASSDSGDFVVAWQSEYQDGADFGIFARRFSASGAALLPEFQANTYTTGAQSAPVVARFQGGGPPLFPTGFVVAWDSFGQDGSFEGGFAQLFAIPFLLDVDGNGSTAALTDGLLLLRYLFGFRGAILIDGAVDDDDCTRCDAASIEAYLAAHTG